MNEHTRKPLLTPLDGLINNAQRDAVEQRPPNTVVRLPAQGSRFPANPNVENGSNISYRMMSLAKGVPTTRCPAGAYG